MMVLGVAGGIGSGKTTVCKIFETLGIPVFNSDKVSKSILFSKEISDQVIALFNDVVDEDGVLCSKKLAKVVFSNRGALEKLNSILHPKVAKAFDTWKTNQQSKFVVKEAAILFESGSYKSCDFVLSVSCSVKKRINRVIKRDGRTRSDILAIISKQWTDEERGELSDFVILNESKKIIPQVIGVYNSVLKKV